MKIVIDIPEREFSLYGSMVKMDMGNEAVRFIAKGQLLSEVLDNLSAEVIRLDEESWELSVTDVLNVIERYR